MFALSDARDYSFSKVPYLEREEEITIIIIHIIIIITFLEGAQLAKAVFSGALMH